MKIQPYLKTLAFILLSSLFLAGACSSDDEPISEPTDQGGNEAEIIEGLAQDVIDQTFFVHTLGFFNASEVDFIRFDNPSQDKIPNFEASTIIAGLLEEGYTVNNGAIFMFVAGQTAREGGLNPTFDLPTVEQEAYVIHVFLRPSDIIENIQPNAIIEPVQPIQTVQANPQSDFSDNGIRRLTQGEFVLNNHNGSNVLDFTSDGSAIQSTRFIVDQNAFTRNADGVTLAGRPGDDTFNIADLLEEVYGNNSEVCILESTFGNPNEGPSSSTTRPYNN